MHHEKKLKIELHNDHHQNFKRYNIPKAQLVIADREDITVFENQIDYTHRIRIRIDHKLKVMAFFSYSDRTRSINPPNEILRCITQDEYKIVKGAK